MGKLYLKLKENASEAKGVKHKVLHATSRQIWKTTSSIVV